MIENFNLRIDKIGPNTVESSTVEQFHLWFRNWNWHSVIPFRAPRPTCIMWSVYNMQSFFWPLDNPVICWHNPAALFRSLDPSMNKSGCCKALIPCIPKYLKQCKKNIFYNIWFYQNHNRRSFLVKITYKFINLKQ